MSDFRQQVLNASKTMTLADLGRLVNDLSLLYKQREQDDFQKQRKAAEEAKKKTTESEEIRRDNLYGAYYDKPYQLIKMLLPIFMKNGFNYTVNDKYEGHTITYSPAGGMIWESVRAYYDDRRGDFISYSLLYKLFGAKAGSNRQPNFFIKNATEADVKDLLMTIITRPDFDIMKFDKI